MKSQNISDIADSLLEKGKWTLDLDILPTGLETLDKALNGGFEKGQTIIIGGRPGMGVGGFLLGLMNHNVRIGSKRTLFVSYRRGINKVLLFAIANFLDQDATKLFLEPPSTKELAKYVEFERNGLLNIICPDGFNIVEVESCIEKMIEGNGLDLIIIDNMQSMADLSDYDPPYFMTGVASAFSRIQRLALTHNFCLVLGSDVHKRAELRTTEPRPNLIDIDNENNLESIADKVLFIYRPEQYGMDSFWESPESSIGKAEIVIAKNDLGSIGSIRLGFNKAR